MEVSEKFNLRLAARDILRIFGEVYGNKKLINLIPCLREMGYTNSRSTLCRWTHKRTLPIYEYGLEIIQSLQPHFKDVYSAYLKPDKTGLVRTQNALGDPRFRSLVLCDFTKRLGDEKIDVVLTAESSGISLSTIIAHSKNAWLAVLEKTHRGDLKEYVPYESEGSTWYISHHVRDLLVTPRKKTRSRETSQKVLIVDDVVRTGRTVKALSKFVPKEYLQGVCALTAIGDKWKKNVSLPDKYITILYNPNESL